MKATIIGSLIVVFCAGVIIGYGAKGVELRSVSHWGCEAPEYIGPTGENESIEVYELKPWKWLDRRFEE